MKRKRNKKNNKNILIVVAVTSGISVFLLCLIVGILHFLNQKGSGESPKKIQFDYSQIEIKKPEIKKALLTKNINSRPGTLLTQIKGVVVHYTANPDTDAMANRNYFESRKECKDKPEYKVSSHYIIGLDGKILLCVPEKEIAYASNDRNQDTLSIECCHPDKTGKFTDATYSSLVHLVAYLCKKYQLDQEAGIIRHYDVTGKNCPKYYVEHPEQWNIFKKDVYNYLIHSRISKNTGNP